MGCVEREWYCDSCRWANFQSCCQVCVLLPKAACSLAGRLEASVGADSNGPGSSPRQYFYSALDEEPCYIFSLTHSHTQICTAFIQNEHIYICSELLLVNHYGLAFTAFLIISKSLVACSPLLLKHVYMCSYCHGMSVSDPSLVLHNFEWT